MNDEDTSGDVHAADAGANGHANTNTLQTTDDAAKELGVHPSTLRGWAKRYDFVMPTQVTPAGHFRWDVDELIRICNARAAAKR